MSSEELSLTWGDHHSTLVGVFEKLLETSTLVDCTIAAEGQYLRAHKVVLSACSPYFELLFAQENEKNPIVILKDVKFQELKSMIDFIYRGKVKIPEDRLEDFIDAAESLQIKGLGGGQKPDSSEKKGNESPSAQKRGGLTSHALRKRRRLSTDDAESKSSPKSDLNSESNSCESVSVTQEPPDILGLSQPEIPSPIVTLTTGSDVISPEVHIEQSDSETNASALPVECTLPSADTERLLEHAASVVKREPEPVAEIFLDDNDCFVDPKKEVCVEEMADLESDGISAVMEYVQQQQSTNQYSGSLPAPPREEATSLAVRPLA
ncbi:Longitudinals lacking protein, isoforms H/M/V, partial [Gryllus bimaculatus]